MRVRYEVVVAPHAQGYVAIIKAPAGVVVKATADTHEEAVLRAWRKFFR